jgi:hypothetical protein
MSKKFSEKKTILCSYNYKRISSLFRFMDTTALNILVNRNAAYRGLFSDPKIVLLKDIYS